MSDMKQRVEASLEGLITEGMERFEIERNLIQDLYAENQAKDEEIGRLRDVIESEHKFLCHFLSSVSPITIGTKTFNCLLEIVKNQTEALNKELKADDK